MLMQERQPMKSSNHFLVLREIFKIRWSIENNLERMHSWNIKRNEPMSIPLSTKWLKKITKWLESIKWNKNRVNKIWSSQSTKRKHSFKDKKSSKNTKKSLCVNMHLSNRRELIICKPWRPRLRHRERQSSINSPWKRSSVVNSKSMWRIFEMIFR